MLQTPVYSSILILYPVFPEKLPAFPLSAPMERFLRAPVICDLRYGFPASKLEHTQNFMLLPSLKGRKGSVVVIKLQVGTKGVEKQHKKNFTEVGNPTQVVLQPRIIFLILFIVFGLL